MDDTPDKVRRNLLVYSSVLLIGWYLDVDARALVSIQGVEVKALDPLKTSIISLMVLLYLTMRFSTSQEYIEGSNYKSHFVGLPHDLILDYLNKAIADHKKNGREGKRCFIFDWEGFSKSLPTFMSRDSGVTRIELDIGGLEVPKDDLVGVIGVICYGMNSDVTHKYQGMNIPRHIKFKLPKAVALSFNAISVWRMFATDSKFIVSKLPMILALVTYLYLLGKISIITLERL